MAAKRWVDPGCWNDPWYQDLSLVNKCFWKYICDNCDCAGVWKVNRRLAEFQIGATIDWDNVLAALGGRVVELSPEKWHVVKFVSFQYGELSATCKPHISVMRTLEHHGLPVCGNSEPEPAPEVAESSKGINTLTEGYSKGIERVSKGYSKGINTLENKNKEENKEEDKDKDSCLLPHTPSVTQGDIPVAVKECVVAESIGTPEGAGAGARASGPAPPKKGEPVKHKHGQYGWVRLTADEYNRLLEEWGNETLRKYITIVDEYAQKTGNGKKYKDWNLVLRGAKRDGWGEGRKQEQNGSKPSTVNGRKLYGYEQRALEELRRTGADANG